MRDEGPTIAPNPELPEPFRAFLALWFARPSGRPGDGRAEAEFHTALREVSATHLATVVSMQGRLMEIATKLATARDPGAALAANVELGCCLTEVGSRNAKAWAEFADRLHCCQLRLKDSANNGGTAPGHG